MPASQPASQPSKRSARLIFIVIALGVAGAAVVAWRLGAGSSDANEHERTGEVAEVRAAASPEPDASLSVRGPARAMVIADALAAREAIDEVIDPDVADKLDSGQEWERGELPKVGRSLVRIEGFIAQNADAMSESAATEVERIYHRLQRIHNDLLLESGNAPGPSAEGLKRKKEYLEARQALERENQHRSEEERSALGAALKDKLMRVDPSTVREPGDE